MDVCVIAYQIDSPDSGSEAGSAYIYLSAIIDAGHNVTLITRDNNIPILNQDKRFEGVRLIGVDLPKWASFYKKGGRGIALFYTLWLWFAGKTLDKLQESEQFEIVHHLNFHNSTYPHHFKNPHGKLYWGPLNHNIPLPNSYIFETPRIVTILKERLKYLFRLAYWHSPFIKGAISRSDLIYYSTPENLPSVFKPAKDKIKQLSPAARPMNSEPGFEKRLIKDTFTLLYIGRFLDIKGAVPALEIFKAFQKEITDSKLIMIGKGPLETALKKQIEEHNLQEHVSIHNWMDQDELVSHYETSHALLFPSLEAQGMVVTEAMEFGLIPIVYEGYGPHLLAKECAKTVPFNNDFKSTITPFVEAIKEIYIAYSDRYDESDYVELCEKSREAYLEKQHPSRLTKRMLEDYK